jgi:hypothetical protein
VIRVRFDPATLDDVQKEWWRAWHARAQAATDVVVDAFEDWLAGNRAKPFKFRFNTEIWKDLKDWLMVHVFHRRCAYCERPISGYYGDAEHYRPKGAVRRVDSAGAMVLADWQMLDSGDGTLLTLGHPGYFWLAYDWRNLLPSCVYCNSGRGKNDRFDVQQRHVVLVALESDAVEQMDQAVRPRESRRWPGHYYLSPESLDERESPLLLNPLNAPDPRDPHEHIRFGVRGIVAAVDDSPTGRNTIEVLRLREETLRQERQRAQEEFQDKFHDRMRRYDPDKGNVEAATLLAEYAQGRQPIAAAVLDFYEGTLIRRYPAPPRR